MFTFAPQPAQPAPTSTEAAALASKPQTNPEPAGRKRRVRGTSYVGGGYTSTPQPRIRGRYARCVE